MPFNYSGMVELARRAAGNVGHEGIAQPIGDVIPFPRPPFRLSPEELKAAMDQIKKNAIIKPIPLVPLSQWPLKPL